MTNEYKREKTIIREFDVQKKLICMTSGCVINQKNIGISAFSIKTAIFVQPETILRCCYPALCD